MAQLWPCIMEASAKLLCQGEQPLDLQLQEEDSMLVLFWQPDEFWIDNPKLI